MFQRKINQAHKKVKAIIDIMWGIYFAVSVFAIWMLSREFTLMSTFILGMLISISMRSILDIVMNILINYVSMQAILEDLIDDGTITSEQRLQDFYDRCKSDYKQGINDRHQELYPYVKLNFPHCIKYMKKQGVTANEDQTV